VTFSRHENANVSLAIVEFSLAIPEWDFSESVTQGYRLSLSKEIYSFVVTGSPVFHWADNLAIQASPISPPLAVVFVVAFALSVYGLLSGIRHLQADPDEKRQEALRSNVVM